MISKSSRDTYVTFEESRSFLFVTYEVRYHTLCPCTCTYFCLRLHSRKGTLYQSTGSEHVASENPHQSCRPSESATFQLMFDVSKLLFKRIQISRIALSTSMSSYEFLRIFKINLKVTQRCFDHDRFRTVSFILSPARQGRR